MLFFMLGILGSNSVFLCERSTFQDICSAFLKKRNLMLDDHYVDVKVLF